MKHRFVEHFHGHRFRWLLALLLMYLLTNPLLYFYPVGRIVINLLFTGVVTITFLSTSLDGRSRPWWSIAIWCMALAGIWTGQFASSGSLLEGATSLSLVFLGMSVVVLLQHVFKQKTVTGETICAALSAYLLAGLFFALVFFGYGRVDPAALSYVTPPEYAAKFLWESIYFSFVTLTTLGYGDVTPVSDFARSIAFVEALCGQLYLAVLIARLVGVYTASDVEARANARETEGSRPGNATSSDR